MDDPPLAPRMSMLATTIMMPSQGSPTPAVAKDPIRSPDSASPAVFHTLIRGDIRWI